MSAATRILRRAAKRTATKLMDKVGQRLVSGLADTSSDAPNAAYAPKRDLYSKMKDGGPAKEAPPAEAEAAPEPADDDRGHSHEHGHSHGLSHHHG